MAQIGADEKPRLLILGGTGFLGRHLAREAVKQGFRVFSYGRRDPVDEEVEAANFDFQSGRLIATPDLKFDVIVNSLACYGRNQEDEAELDWVNHLLPKEVIRHFFVDGPKIDRPSLFLNIDTALNDGVSVYSKTKTALRNHLLDLAKHGQPMIGLRLDQFYGPGDSATKFVSMLVAKFIAKAPHVPLSSGLQVRRFLYVRDAVDVLLEIIQRSLVPNQLPFSSEAVAILPWLGVESTVRDVVLKTQEICRGKATRLDFGVLPDRGIEIAPRKMVSGFEFLEERPFVTLDEGITSLYEFERKQ